MLRELVSRNRSYRRFFGDEKVSRETLKELVDLARHSASAANMQPLRFILSHDPEKNGRVFPTLQWAGYLKEWPGPEEGERPSAYIIILGDTDVSKNFWCDHGIAAQSILLGAVEKGLGGCMLGAIKKDLLRAELEIPSQYEILLVVALGRPNETVKIDDVGPDKSIKYWRDHEDVHHVPKRILDDLILE